MSLTCNVQWRLMRPTNRTHMFMYVHVYTSCINAHVCVHIHTCACVSMPVHHCCNTGVKCSWKWDVRPWVLRNINSELVVMPCCLV